MPTTAQDSLAQLEDLARRELKQGAIAYNPPEKMRSEETATVEVRITRRETPELGSDLQGEGQTRIEKLPVGTLMRVELKSSDFDITERRPSVQSLWEKGHRTWLWDIKPKKSGDLTLSLVASVVYEGETLEYTALDRSIRVEVTPAQTAKRWMGIVGVVLAAVASLVGIITGGQALLVSRRKRETKQQQPGP